MATKSIKTTEGASGGMARALEAAAKKILEQGQRDLADRIKPALKLAELADTGEVGKASTAHRKIAQQVRASLQLPHLASLTEQTRAAAAAIPAHMEHRPALPSPPGELMDATASPVAITSAHDMGLLVREAREQRKLSQQAFADLVGVGRRFISELENGKATLELDKVLQVASASGIDVLARRRR